MTGKWFPKGDEAEEFLAFPVLAAIARRPMSTREVARVLGMRTEAVRKRVKALEKMGYIVSRAGDRRWVMIVRLMAVTMAPRSVPNITPSEDPAIVIGDMVLEPQDASGGALQESEPLPPVGENSGASESPIGGRTRVAAQLGVPEELHFGVLSLGKMEPCVGCGKYSPVKYGGSAVCKNCARVWDSVGEQNAVQN